ncbi:MAG: hypothetical protein HZC43_11375 [Nitrosomonadales bacterium]|nr:hypothetical protein [Nitrosomonadales bacterium]
MAQTIHHSGWPAPCALVTNRAGFSSIAPQWAMVLRLTLLASGREHRKGEKARNIIEYGQRTMHRPPDANNATPDANNSLTGAAENLPRLTIQDIVAALRFNAC